MIRVSNTGDPFNLIDQSVPKVVGRQHLLDLDDFSRKEIEGVVENTDAMKDVLKRDIKKIPT